MRDFLWKCWFSLNYRLCMVEAYLASQRGESVVSSEWQAKASSWEREYQMCGRTLV